MSSSVPSSTLSNMSRNAIPQIDQSLKTKPATSQKTSFRRVSSAVSAQTRVRRPPHYRLVVLFVDVLSTCPRGGLVIYIILMKIYFDEVKHSRSLQPQPPASSMMMYRLLPWTWCKACSGKWRQSERVESHSGNWSLSSSNSINWTSKLPREVMRTFVTKGKGTFYSACWHKLTCRRMRRPLPRHHHHRKQNIFEFDRDQV